MIFSLASSFSSEELLSRLASGPRGLTEQEARDRLQKNGANRLEAQEPSAWRLWLRQFQSAFIYLLLVAMMIAFALGDRLEAGLMLLFVLINSSLGFYQEFQSQHALAVLRGYVTKRSRVLRDGALVERETSELVSGDVIALQAGDGIPAEVRLIEATDVEADESSLTGESATVAKTLSALDHPRAITDATNVLFSGTHVARGQAMAVVFATGRDTSLGDISRLAIEPVRVSAFEQHLKQFSAFLIKLIIVTIALTFAINVSVKGVHAGVIDLLIFSIALAVSVIPEALPLVTIISHARGALRLATQQVVVKRLTAIEDLGSIEVLCTDKTGTITENKMTVADVWSIGHDDPLAIASLAAHDHASFDDAILKRCPQKKEATKLLHLLPFDPERRRASALIANGRDRVMIVRGAPEAVMNLCAHLTESEKNRASGWAETQGKNGRRVLAIASKTMPQNANRIELADESRLTLAGLIAFDDPLKPTAASAIAHARRLGVVVKMLTGDSAEVATAIARRVGLLKKDEYAITGATFETLSTTEQKKAVHACHAFARLSPQQKFSIIQLLQKTREVGFLGEGINDAPALHIANVGLVVQGASDIARDAADVILLDRSLDVIVNGIRIGREVFANTIKYITATLAPNIGNFLTLAIASLVMNDLPMLPVQILLVNLLSDTPMIAIATDGVDASELKRPRHYSMRAIAVTCLTLGLVSTVFDFMMFRVWNHAGVDRLRTNWFMGSILTELLFIFSIRAKRWFFQGVKPSRLMLTLALIVAIVTVSLPFASIGQSIFHLVVPSLNDLGILALILAGYLLATETVKIMGAGIKPLPSQG